MKLWHLAVAAGVAWWVTRDSAPAAAAAGGAAGGELYIPPLNTIVVGVGANVGQVMVNSGLGTQTWMLPADAVDVVLARVGAATVVISAPAAASIDAVVRGLIDELNAAGHSNISIVGGWYDPSKGR